MQLSKEAKLGYDLKKDLKFYLCFKFIAYVQIQQLPFAIAHFLEANSNHSICLYDPFIANMNYKTWFTLDFIITIAFGFWMILMMTVKRRRQSSSDKGEREHKDMRCRVKPSNLKILFFLSLFINICFTLVKAAFSTILMIFWLSGQINSQNCDVELKFALGFESATTLIALSACVFRFIYFFFCVQKEQKIRELVRIDQLGENPDQ